MPVVVQGLIETEMPQESWPRNASNDSVRCPQIHGWVIR